MSCYLIILYRKHCAYYRIGYNCTNRIQQSLQLFFVIFNLFRASLIQMKPVCDAFLDFQICSPSNVFQNCDYLFCLTCKNKKNYERAESEETKESKKKIIFNSNKEFVRGHSFMTSAKKSKFRTPTHLFPSYNHPILKF